MADRTTPNETDQITGGTERGRPLAGRRPVVVSAGNYPRRAVRRAADIPQSDRERAGAFKTFPVFIEESVRPH